MQAGTWDQLQTSSWLLIRSGRLQSTSQSLSSNDSVTTEANAIRLTSKQDVRRSQRRARQGKDAESQLDAEATVGLRAQIFYRDIFLKSEGEKKWVLHDLKTSKANAHPRRNSVKQDGVNDLKGIVEPGDRFALWDLRKMFFQAAVQQRLRGMLRTKVRLRSDGEWQVQRLQNATMSMGLTVAPEIATKLFADVL